MFQRPAPAENAQEFQRITQIPQNSPTTPANSTKFAPFVNISYVSDTCPGRELPKIRANQAKFAQFAHISRELREFRAFCSKLIHIKLTSFRSLTTKPRKIGVNQPDFTQFAHSSRESREVRWIRTHDQ